MNNFFSKPIFRSILFGLIAGLAIVGLLNIINGKGYQSLSKNHLSFNHAIRAAAPAVVNIYNIGAQTSLEAPSLQGLGSGVIMSENGYILTNYHVITQADQILVALQNGMRFSATVQGSDPLTDLAVLKIDATNLPSIPIDLKKTHAIGDVVLAIGNPYNLGQSITQGIISATGRVGMSVTGQQDFLQTDAAINEGNSGGALVDSDGTLVGINTAAFTMNNQVGGRGLNFAIPVKLAFDIMQKLIKYGQVTRSYIGINGRELSYKQRQFFNLGDAQAIQITGVTPSGPAAIAGIQANDIIIGFNGQAIQNAATLKDTIAELPPQTEIYLSIIRANQRFNVTVILGELSAN